jgi:hypothetical protein
MNRVEFSEGNAVTLSNWPTDGLLANEACYEGSCSRSLDFGDSVAKIQRAIEQAQARIGFGGGEANE